MMKTTAVDFPPDPKLGDTVTLNNPSAEDLLVLPTNLSAYPVTIFYPNGYTVVLPRLVLSQENGKI
jgi:hypothetical protein